MDASSPARRRRRLGRLALVFGIVGVAAAVGLMVINEVAPGMSGAARYSTAPAIDWFTIMLTVGGLLLGARSHRPADGTRARAHRSRAVEIRRLTASTLLIGFP
ncbi:hypothetical protein [Frigoribacterium sp. 2355]